MVHGKPLAFFTLSVVGKAPQLNEIDIYFDNNLIFLQEETKTDGYPSPEFIFQLLIITRFVLQAVKVEIKKYIVVNFELWVILFLDLYFYQ